MNKRLRKLLIFLAALMAATAPLLAAEPDPNLLESAVLLKVDGRVTIDELGQVTDYAVATPLENPLRSTLEQVVRTWRFEPVLIDGVPRRARAKLRVVLAAVKQGDGMRISIDNVLTPGESDLLGMAEEPMPAPAVAPPTRSNIVRPDYPLELLKSGVMGSVLLGMRYGDDGKVIEVMAIQSMLFDIKGQQKPLQHAVKLLEKSAIAAARQWTLKVDAKANPDRTVIAPVEYRLSDTRSLQRAPGHWRSVVRTAKRPVPWLPQGAAAGAGVADANEGEMLTAASALKLASNVIGSPLL